MIWENCLDRLQEEVSSDHFNMWLRPLQSDWDESARRLRLFAPNRHVVDQVNQAFLDRITALLQELTGQAAQVCVEIGSRRRAVGNGSASLALDANAPATASAGKSGSGRPDTASSPSLTLAGGEVVPLLRYGLDTRSTFENFVCGKSNDLARAAAMQVGENPGQSYNPLFIYGGVGLGKTHLMHAVGNAIVARNPKARVVYIRSEDFVNQLVTSFHNNNTNEFRRRYRSVDALFIDDIHFFVNKSSSQEELFHTFNALVEGGQQIILTSDRFPKEIEGLEERLKSRFSWGLTVSVEPPELETRVAILVRKATDRQLVLPQDVAFFMAQKIRGNVRDLEGALTKVVALADFRNVPITADLARDALRDLLAMQARLIQIDNIQRTVAEYYKIKLTDLLSAKRNRSLARPRQMAMALAKELTSHSLPEIGDQFGKRDHTTVLHGVRKIAELRNTHPDIEEDWRNLSRLLTS